MRDILPDIKSWLEDGQSIALATVVHTWGSSPRGVGSKMVITSDGKFVGSVSGGCVENAVIEAGMRSLETNQPQLLHFGIAGETAWDVGLACGGNQERFPQVDELIQVWPEEAFAQINVTGSTAIVMLTHDPKLDDPALQFALSSPAFYVGALGSKSTHLKRRKRLLNAGLSESQLSRLHAPVGLDIGAESPEENALAILAEVVETQRKQMQASAAVEAALHPVTH